MGERGGGVSVVACESVLTSTPASAAMVGSKSRCEVAHAVEAPIHGTVPRRFSEGGSSSRTVGIAMSGGGRAGGGAAPAEQEGDEESALEDGVPIGH